MPPDRRSDAPGDRDRIEHMLAAARDAVSYVRGRGRPDLDADSMLRRALVQCVEVIGEAAARTSEAGRARVPVDLDAVWRVVDEHLPPMIPLLEDALTRWGDEGMGSDASTQ